MKQNKRSKRFYLFLFNLLVFLVLAVFWEANALTEVRLPQSDQPAELYSNQTQDDLKQTYLKALQNAKKSILLIVYTLNDRQIIGVLKEKANQGIDVRVICDAKASPQINRLLGAKIKTIKRSSPGLMHQKILVVDRADCWIGSANMTGDSLRMHGNLVLAMHHEGIAEMILAKSEGMGARGKAAPVLHREFLLGSQKAELWFLPDNREAISHLIGLIQRAAKSLRIAMFTWTHPDLTRAVIAAKDRGLDVQVVIDHNAGKGSSAETVKKLSDAGVPVHLSQGNALLHYKLLYIDETELVNGSANWTRAAFTQNDDCFIILHQLTTQQKTAMENLWNVIWLDSTAQWSKK